MPSPEEEGVRVEGSSKGQNMTTGEGQNGLPTLGQPKRKRDGDDSGDRPRKRSPALSSKTPISTERQLDLANSQELEKGPVKLVEKSIGGGELVGNEDLWACLFGGSLHRKEVGVVVRRELLAGAAENRAL